jgi:hypothetical protein
MITEEDQLKELQFEVERLGAELERYRTATEDCLQQIGWCIGYFTGTNKSRLARALAANVAYVRRSLLHLEPINLPPSVDGAPAS